MTVEPWLFATPPIRARDPQVALFAFDTGSLGREIDLASEADRFGAPTPEAHRTCRVQTIARCQDPAWFDAFRSGSLRAIATQDLGAGTAALDAADHVHVIAAQPRAVTDLTYRLGELLQLNNTARILVDDAGRDLMGVAARTPAS